MVYHTFTSHSFTLSEVREAQRYKIDVLAVQEMRWVGQSILEKKECTICYSCHKSLPQFGTGFIINKNIRHLVIDLGVPYSHIS
jgi:hypothetical protein